MKQQLSTWTSNGNLIVKRMTDYQILKFLHFLGFAFLFGTGLGTAFFMFMVGRSKNIGAIKITTKLVILADWIFTAPAVVIQPITGVLLMQQVSYSFSSAWFIAVSLLYLFVGICWLPVVYIQYRLYGIANSLEANQPLPTEFQFWFRIWQFLGYPAFTAMLAILFLMVSKPWL